MACRAKVKVSVKFLSGHRQNYRLWCIGSVPAAESLDLSVVALCSLIFDVRHSDFLDVGNLVQR